jgi:hypothetical protein
VESRRIFGLSRRSLRSRCRSFCLSPRTLFFGPLHLCRAVPHLRAVFPPRR